MKSNDEYDQIWQSIYDIRKEVLKNKKRIEKGRKKMEEAKKIIPKKKAIISSLKLRLEQLQKHNEAYHQNIIQKNKFAEQADQLYQLTSYFQAVNKQYDDSNRNVEDLSRENQIKIGMKIDDVISQINSEYTYNSIDYSQEQNHLNEINASVDREIDLLKLMRPDLVRYTDDFDIILDEYIDKYSPEDIPDFRSFRDIEFTQNDDSDLQIQSTETNIPQPSPLSITGMQGEIVNVIKDCKQKSKFIRNEYLNQHQELIKMIEALKNRPIDLCDQLIIENCLQRRMQMMRAIGPIKPIQIPSQSNEKKSLTKPLIDVFNKFDSFFDTVKKYQENRNLNQQPQLEIPPFQIPNEPRCIRNSTPNSELVKFAEDLNSIMEQTKRMIPIEWNNSITRTYRSLLNLERYEINIPISNSISDPIIESKEEVNSEPPEFDKSSFNRFREIFSTKFPDNLSYTLDTKRLALEIPNAEQTDLNKSTLNDDTDEQFLDDTTDSNLIFMNRIKKTNMILRELTNKTRTDVPQLQFPKTPEVNQPEIESNSLIEKVKEVLSPNQQTIRYLKNEIANINARIGELSNKTIDKEEEDEDDQNSESQESIEADIDRLNDQLAYIRERYRQLGEKMRELCEKRDRIKKENDDLKQFVSSNDSIDDIISQKEEELQNKKTKFQQFKDAWLDSQDLLSQLRAQT